MTDTEIVELALLKSRAGAEALYDRYCRGVWLAIIRIAPNKVTAEIAMQQAYITIWRDIELYDPEAEKLFTFMIRIARDQARVLMTEK